MEDEREGACLVAGEVRYSRMAVAVQEIGIHQFHPLLITVAESALVKFVPEKKVESTD